VTDKRALPAMGVFTLREIRRGEEILLKCVWRRGRADASK
jgi:hypothetical protein